MEFIKEMSCVAFKKHLFKFTKQCFYCGCEMTDINPNHPSDLPDNYYTIEHVFNNKNPMRLLGMPSPLVLACKKCNEAKGFQDLAKEPSEILEESMIILGKLYEPEYSFYRKVNSGFFAR